MPYNRGALAARVDAGRIAHVTGDLQISGDVYSVVTIATVAAYITGNVAQRNIEKADKAPDAPAA